MGWIYFLYQQGLDVNVLQDLKIHHELFQETQAEGFGADLTVITNTLKICEWSETI